MDARSALHKATVSICCPLIPCIRKALTLKDSAISEDTLEVELKACLDGPPHEALTLTDIPLQTRDSHIETNGSKSVPDLCISRIPLRRKPWQMPLITMWLSLLAKAAPHFPSFHFLSLRCIHESRCSTIKSSKPSDQLIFWQPQDGEATHAKFL